MTDESIDDGLRARLNRQGEEVLGRIAQELLESPIVSGALQRGFEARERAAQAQEAAMGALNLPSASDLERLTRRVRSVAQRLEGVEDGVDRLADRLQGAPAANDAVRLEALEQRLAALDDAIAGVAASVAELGKSSEGLAEPAPAKSAPKRAATKPAAKRTAKPAAKRAPARGKSA